MEKKTFWIMLVSTIVMGLAVVVLAGGYYKKSSALGEVTMENEMLGRELQKYKELYSDLNVGVVTADTRTTQAEDELRQCRENMVSLQSQVDTLMMQVGQGQAQ